MVRMAVRVGLVPAIALLVAGAVTAAVDAQGPRQAVPPLVPESLVGSLSFDLYCASCHGRFGRGDGPTAAALKTRPADLTMLARSNRGAFPRERVLAFIEGSARAAGHGSPEMSPRSDFWPHSPGPDSWHMPGNGP